MFGSLNSPYLTAFRVTGLVVPLIVRSPVTRYLSPPACSIFVLLKVMVGYLSTSRNVDERRSLSRCSLWVRMLEVLIVASTWVLSGCSGSMVPPAVTSAKWPRTVIMPRCLAENSTCVCIGSNFHAISKTPLAGEDVIQRLHNRLEPPLIS